MGFTASLFLNVIILLLHKGDGSAISLAKKILAKYDQIESKGIPANSEEYSIYVDIITAIIDGNLRIEDTRDLDTILSRYRHYKIFKDEPDIFERLKCAMTDTTILSDTKCNRIRSELCNNLALSTINEDCRKIFGLAQRAAGSKYRTSVDAQKQILADIVAAANDMLSKVADTTSDRGDSENALRVMDIDMTDQANITKAFEAHKTIKSEITFRTGLQGLNKALGGGWYAGQTWIISALSHNGKSTSLMKVARWLVTYNEAPLHFKNPTCVIYSLENESQYNLVSMYRELYINMFDELPDPNTSIEDMVYLIYSKFREHGWRLVIHRKLPSEFGFAEMKADFENMERDGYTPLVCIVDYMSKMRLPNDGGPRHQALGQLYEHARNYLSAKNCSLVTAHQLSRKATEVTETTPNGAIKRFNNSMLADSTDPWREADIHMYQNIERDPTGRKFMTFRVDKLRGVEAAPNDNSRYFAYYMDPVLGIRDDLGGESQAISNIFTYPMDGTETASPSNRDNDVSTDHMTLI